MGAHLIDGEFQSDKYPTTPRGKVPLSVKDTTAQDLLWEYAQRRRVVDAEFSADLERALLLAGYQHAPTRCLRHGVPCVSNAAHEEMLCLQPPDSRPPEAKPENWSGRLTIGDVVQFKATGYVATVARFAHDGTTDFWADNGTGPYKQADVERLKAR